jgi:hypothetical protein
MLAKLKLLEKVNGAQIMHLEWMKIKELCMTLKVSLFFLITLLEKKKKVDLVKNVAAAIDGVSHRSKARINHAWYI